MRTGLYTLGELFGNRHIGQLVIPEIQRDYVWQAAHVRHLMASLTGNFHAWREAVATPAVELVAVQADAARRTSDPAEMQSLKEDFNAFQARRRHATNIGFIYAYCDADLPGQYFLIDGQQRLTTLYLALLAVASGSAALGERFRARYCLADSTPTTLDNVAATRLDYRLREHTSTFFRRCVGYHLQHGDGAGDISEQSWYLRRLETDKTISNVTANYATIESLLRSAGGVSESLRADFFNYLENLVECWYFDTNESAQGEELYIYLNARGESIADNENLKARLLGEVRNPAEKADWGREWEDWQDYFWAHRNHGLEGKETNPNADRGFNSFLSCLGGLMAYRTPGSSGAVDLATIREFIGILKWLEESKKSFAEGYGYADWVDAWFREFWAILNQEKETDWSADIHDDNRSIERNRMVLVWGSLLCALDASGQTDVSRTFRAIRFLYLRYHNNSRSVTILGKLITALLTGGTTGEFTQEELQREAYLGELTEEVRVRHESVIWQIEDHPLNLNGRDVGNTNLTHLVDLEDLGITLDRLERVRDAFHKLLPRNSRADEKQARKVALALLHYGRFWNRISPWYYENLDLGDWRRTIRAKGNAEAQTSSARNSHFRRFFEDFMENGDTIDDFLSKRNEKIPAEPEKTDDFLKALVWYGSQLGTGMFSKGMFIAADPPSNPNKDSNFGDLTAIWNSKGDFKGNKGAQKLSEILLGPP